jgi:3-hydroxyacyl-[acyl-carrier-protein] dehydratase
MALDIQAVLEQLPHRYPFVMVDRVLEAGPGGVKAIKNVTVNEPHFQGHFPGRPVMPGVLIIEAMAQASGFLLEGQREPGSVALLAGVENARFRRPVVPGDQLLIDCSLVYFRRGLARASAKVSVEGQVVAEAEILFAIGK